jgi:DNA-binding NarL/FixJ family response regulator
MSDRGLIRVLSVDDHPLLREGIATIVNSQPDMLLAASASTGAEGVERFREHRPDVTLLDLRLPDMSGIDALIAMRTEWPGARIAMLSTFDGDAEVRRALAAGAQGYFLKSMPPADLVAGIRQVNAGRKGIPAEVASRLAEHVGEEQLTNREIEILAHLAGGNRNRDIAERLFISQETVKAHVRHIMEKLGASDRTQAVTMGARRGIIRL